VLVVTFVLLAVVVVGWGWLVTHPLARTLDPRENDLSRWIVDQRTPTLDVVADVGTFMGETVVGAVFLALLGLGFAVWQRTVRPLLFVVVAYGGLGLLYVLATHVDERQRPPVRILDPGLIPDHSFPSGHTATATAIALCVLALTSTYAPSARRWVLPLLALPLLTLLSRLYQGAHHLSDVLTALAYAAVWVGACWVVLLRRHTERPG
jgi:undecaprenyl-diphosphatase